MSWRLIIAGAVFIAVLAAVGGFYIYQKSIMDGLREEITDRDATIKIQQEQIAGLELDKAKLQSSNDSLKNQIDRKADEMKAAYEEIAQLRETDARSQERLAKFEKQLSDIRRSERVKAIRKSKKASLLLKIINKNVECELENFHRIDGRCVRGKFREYPKESNPKKESSDDTKAEVN